MSTNTIRIADCSSVRFYIGTCSVVKGCIAPDSEGGGLYLEEPSFGFARRWRHGSTVYAGKARQSLA